MKNTSGVALAVSMMCLFFGIVPARADGFVAPSVGVDFGGSAGSSLRGSAHDSSKVSFGVAAGFMGKGVFGVEEDVSYGPNFFGSGGTFDNTRVATLMTNLIVGIPIGGQTGSGVRPYASGGVGLIYRNVDLALGLSHFSSTDFGYDVGAGVMGYFADHIGLRVDARYFRNAKETGSNAIGLAPGDFNFYRGSIGVLFRF